MVSKKGFPPQMDPDFKLDIPMEFQVPLPAAPVSAKPPAFVVTDAGGGLNPTARDTRDLLDSLTHGGVKSSVKAGAPAPADTLSGSLTGLEVNVLPAVQPLATDGPTGPRFIPSVEDQADLLAEVARRAAEVKAPGGNVDAIPAAAAPVPAPVAVKFSADIGRGGPVEPHLTHIGHTASAPSPRNRVRPVQSSGALYDSRGADFVTSPRADAPPPRVPTVTGHTGADFAPAPPPPLPPVREATEPAHTGADFVPVPAPEAPLPWTLKPNIAHVGSDFKVNKSEGLGKVAEGATFRVAPGAKPRTGAWAQDPAIRPDNPAAKDDKGRSGRR